MNLVTDPDILRQLNGDAGGAGKPVTDPAILAQLNGTPAPKAAPNVPRGTRTTPSIKGAFDAPIGTTLMNAGRAALGAVGSAAKSVGETALGAATGALAYPIGVGAEAISGLAGMDPQTGKDFRNYVTNAYTYHPDDPAAQGALGIASKVGEAGMLPSTLARKAVGYVAGPEAERMVGPGLETANMLLAPKIGEGAKYLAGKIPAELPRNIALKVLKPSLSKDWTAQSKNLAEDSVPPGVNMTPAEYAYENTKRNRATDTIIDNKIQPNKQGAMQVNKLRHDTGQAIGDLLNDGRMVDMEPTYLAMRDAGYRTARSAAERAEVDAAVQDARAQYGQSVPSTTAHSMKQEAQYGQRNNYGKYSPHIEDAIEKGKGYGLNQQLRAQYPEYQGLNQQYDNLRNAQLVTEKAGPRIANNTNDVSKLMRAGRAGIGGYAGSLIGGPAGAAIGTVGEYLMDKAVTSPAARMRTAFTLDQLRKWGTGGKTAYSAADFPKMPPEDNSGAYPGRAYPELPAPDPKALPAPTREAVPVGGAYGYVPKPQPTRLALPDLTTKASQDYVSSWHDLLDSSEAQQPAFLQYLHDQLSEKDPRAANPLLKKAQASVPVSERLAVDRAIRQELEDRMKNAKDVPGNKAYPDYANMPQTKAKPSTRARAAEALDSNRVSPRYAKYADNSRAKAGAKEPITLTGKEDFSSEKAKAEKAKSRRRRVGNAE